MRSSLLVVLLMLVGCERPAPVPRKPELVKADVSWTRNLLEVKGGQCKPCKVRFALGQVFKATEPQLSIASEDGAVDVKITWAGQTVTGRAAFRHTLKVPKERFGATNLSDGKVQLNEKAKVEFEGLEPFEVTLPAQAIAIDVLFTNGVVAFENDAPEDAALTAYVMLIGKHSMRGPGLQARDVDWVITETKVDGAQKSCSGYRNTRTGERSTVLAISTHSKMTVVDRRTGAVVKEDVLKAGAPVCPSLAFGMTASATDVSDARLNEWVLTAMKAKK